MEELDQDFSRKKVSEDEAGIFGNLDDVDGEYLLEGENDKRHQKSPSQCPFCLEECKMLRVLSCLHVFCEDCVKQFVETQKNTESQKPGNLSGTNLRGLLSCPTCQQETLLGERGLISLPVDPVSQDKVSSQGRKPPVFICTACKNNDKADAKCLDCNNFLCSKCYSFHQYMRCFENHKVLSIEAFVDDETIEQELSNPLCGEHPTEELRFYCNTCQMAACTQCLGDYHAGSAHCTERMRDAESRCRDELQLLCDKTNSHQTVCRQTARKLETLFGELQTQSDTARESIETAHQFYMAQVAKKRDEMLVELKNLHKMLELKIMDASHRVERVRERMDHALDYTHKILELDNPVEILKLRAQIKSQLTLLLSTPSSEDLNITMKFENDPKQFDEMLKTLYGRFVTRGEGASPKFFAAEALTPSPTPLPQTPSLNSFPVMNKFAFEPSTVLQGPTGPYNMLGTITSAQERNIKQLAALIHQQLGPSDDPSKQKFASCLPDPVENSVALTGQTLNNLQALAMLSMQSNQRFGAPATEQNLHLLTPPLRNKMGSGNAFPWGADSSTANPPPPYSLPSRQPFPVEPETSRSVKAFSPPLMMSSSAKQVPSSKFLPMQVRVKFGQLGFEQGQFNSPHGFCLGSGEDILVADTNNHRVQVFDQKGNFKFQFGEPGKDDGQLWFPRKIAVLRGSGNMVVCDRGNARSRIQLFSCTGLYLKKFSISYMEIVAGIVVNHRNNILMVDSVNPSVYELNVSGALETWFDCSNIMREPSDIAVYNEKYYICDFKASCVAVFDDSGKCISRIGDEGVLPFPNGIDISAAGEIVVGTSHGNRFRVIVFDNVGALIAQYECPHIKVSRCCGLRITSKGYIVTLAKNSHHVLVFNTLYVM